MLPDNNPIGKRPILVTGSRGQLGAAFVDRLAGTRSVIGVDLDELDLTNVTAVERFVTELGPGLIVNCMAFNDVDGAETAPLAALRANVMSVVTLVRVARACRAILVHYGSDFVFDGEQAKPYTETDTPAPLSVYGMSKLLGEQAATRADYHYVLRLSSLYGGHTHKPAVDRMLTLARAGSPVRAFGDRTVAPSYVPDVVEATLVLVSRGAPSGLYHCGSADWCTWSELAAHLLTQLDRHDLLQIVPFVSSDFKAVRPKHCALRNVALEREGIRPRRWRDALVHYLARSSVNVPAQNG